MKSIIWVPHSIKKLVSQEVDALVLTEDALSPVKCISEYVDTPLESYDYIYSKGILETTNFIRDFLKKCNYLLRVGGQLHIEFFTSGDLFRVGQPYRPLGFLMYEYSVAISEYFKFVSQKIDGRRCELLFEKTRSANPDDDSIERWSFGIVSNGKRNDQVLRIMKQISDLNIPEYEILICGPAPASDLPNNVRVLSDADLYSDHRAPTPRKKNRIIENARYNNLVIIHDRFFFPPNWFEGMKRYGNYFEILTNPVYGEGRPGKRVLDWISYNNNLLDFRNNKVLLLPYTKWHHDMYVDGGYMVAKKHVLLKNKYDPRVHWGEGEDVHLSKSLFINGIQIALNKYVHVTTMSERNRSVGIVGLKYSIRKILGFADRRVVRLIKHLGLFISFLKFLKKPIGYDFRKEQEKLSQITS